MKKLLAALLSATLCLSLLAACGKAPGETPSASSFGQEPAQEAATLRIGAIKGPSSMGVVRLMKDAETGEGLINDYTFTLAASADEITPKLIQGELDMAYLPPNLAAVLYQKTQGEVVTLGVGTLGILYVMENGNAVRALADLKGKTIVAAGKGSTPEYTLRYLLSESGLDPDRDVTIDWKSEHSECVAALASGAATVAMLPQPFVTVAQSKLPDLRVALDMTKEWDALDNGSTLITGVVVARKAAIQANPAAIEVFLQEYRNSVEWVNGNVTDSAALIGEYGIVDAAVAEKALPACNIVCLTGGDMKIALAGYLAALYEQNPEAVGGMLPEDDFYYGA